MCANFHVVLAKFFYVMSPSKRFVQPGHEMKDFVKSFAFLGLDILKFIV